MGRAPDFPEFRQVELDDEGFLVKLLKQEQPEVSELSFPNIYLWRNSYDFRIAAFAGGVVIRAKDKSGEPFFLPPICVEEPAEAVHAIFSLLLSEGVSPKLCRVPESMAFELEKLGFHIELDRDNSDYVYLSDDLINLSGRKFHRKRNHITQFKSAYNYEYSRVTSELIPECVELQNTWCDVRDCFIPENRSLAEEHSVVMEAFSVLEPLGLIAGAILINGSVAAFGIGGWLNDDTLVIHFEKANPAYPGLYQVINREFCADAARSYRYVNREQDLGDPGLRKAKESYYPHHMVNKYIVTPGKC